MLKNKKRKKIRDKQLAIIGILIIFWGIFRIYANVQKVENNEHEKQIRDLVEATIVDVSEVRSEEHGVAAHRYTFYYQDFNATYEYEGSEYKVRFYDFSVRRGGFREGDTELVYVSKENPRDIMLKSYSDMDYGLAILCFLYFPLGALILSTAMDEKLHSDVETDVTDE